MYGGGYFPFFTQNRPQNHKKHAILHTLQANGGGSSPPAPPPLATLLTATNEISIKFIKIAAHVIASILTKLYNICISEGSFPNILKLSQIIPIYEKGPKNLCPNYRPIFLLSPFSKIFEKCLYNQLINYLNKKKLITNY